MTNTDQDGPLFTGRDFEPPGNDVQRKLQTLTATLVSLLGLHAPSSGGDAAPDGEESGLSVTRQLGIVTPGVNSDQGELFVAAVFLSRAAVARVLGPTDNDPVDSRLTIALARTMTLLRASYSLVLPDGGPEWSIHAYRKGSGSRFVGLLPCTDPRLVGIEEFIWWQARDHAWAQNRPDLDQHPIVALVYRYSARSLVGLSLDNAVELVAPAFVWTTWALQEFQRPVGHDHPKLTELRECGRNPLDRVDSYPADFDLDDPLDRLEFLLAKPFVERIPHGVAFEYYDIVAAHLAMRRRDPGIGVTGIAEIADHLAKLCGARREED